MAVFDDLVPVFGVLLSGLQFDEQSSPAVVPGGVLAIVGATLTNGASRPVVTRR